MLIYLLKFSACLTIFMVFYKVFLERENMHHVKRWFLLVSLILSLSIPLVTFTTYIEPTVVEYVSLPTQSFETFSEVPEIPVETNYLPIVLWSIYTIGALLFGIKFILNLYQIFRKIQTNPKQKNNTFIHVLLTDLVIPHTFFNYIFLNKNKYDSKSIPSEVFWHEHAHAKQKHSLDVLFLELLQIVFWFHPLIYLMKYNIKLNHEFLADQAVLTKGTPPSAYQHILLEFTSNSIETKLANAINYSSIKKRFTVMKTHTSKQKIWLKSVLILPLVAMTLYGFSETKEVIKQDNLQLSKNEIIQEILIYVNKDNQLSLNEKSVQLENLYQEVNNLNRHLTIEQKKVFLSAEIQYEDEGSKGLINQIQDVLFKCHIYQTGSLNVSSLKNLGTAPALRKNKYIGKTIEEAEAIYESQTIDLSPPKATDKNSPWQIEVGVNAVTFTEIENNDIPDATEEMLDEYNSIVKRINSKPSDDKVFKLKDINRMELIYSQMTKEQRLASQPLPNIYDVESNNQQKVTPEEISEYNKLASQHNNKPEGQGIYKQKDVERMMFLLDKMSKEQKANAEPFPNFPPPPSPETGFIEVNGATLWYVKFNPIRYYNKKGYLVDKNGKTINGNKQVNASDVLPGQYIIKVYKDDKVVVDFKDNMSNQQKATPKEVAEYNKLAKHYNTQTDDNRVIKLKDMRRLREVYDKMNKEQRANAEPLPNFPPPPPPPTTSKESPQVVKMRDLPPPPPIPANATLEQKKKYQSAMENYNSQKEGYTYKHKTENGKLVDVVVIPEGDEMVPPPPPPPTPKSPLDHVVEMAKKGATFYYEGKSISSDEAIQLLNENKDLNISTQQADSKEPKVYISKNPIKIVPQNKSKEPILINGKKVKGNTISMTKEQLAKISLSTKDGDISSFMFKIPGVKTESITGNKLNDVAIANIEKVRIGDAIQLLMIKDSNKVVHPPVLITIKK